MSPLSRVLGILIVVLVGACALPLPSRAASIELTWTDPTSAVTQPDGTINDSRPTHANVYRQTVTGVVLNGLAGRWTEVGEAPRTAVDEDLTKPGFTQKFVWANVAVGTYTFAVTLENSAGVSDPSNAAVVEVTPTTAIVRPLGVTGLSGRQLP